MGQNVGAEDVLNSLIKCKRFVTMVEYDVIYMYCSFRTREKDEVLKRFFQDPEFILKSVLEDEQVC